MKKELSKTYDPSSSVIRAAAAGDFEAFAAAELEERKAAMLPPFCRLSAIHMESRDSALVAAWAGMYAKSLSAFPDLSAGEAVPSAIEKADGSYRWIVVLKSSSAATAVKAEVRLYDRLFTVPDPLQDGSDGFLKYLNPDSLKTLTAYVEPALASAAPGESFQFERTGYFVADSKDSAPGAPVFNRTVTLKDSYRPS